MSTQDTELETAMATHRHIQKLNLEMNILRKECDKQTDVILDLKQENQRLMSALNQAKRELVEQRDSFLAARGATAIS